MPELRIAVGLAGMGLPLRKALHTAAGLGADGVEIDARGEISPQLSRTGVRQVRKMLEDLRLRVSAVAFRTRRGYYTTANLDGRIDATKAAMKFAHDLGASVVVNHIGRVPSDRESDAWRLLVEVLSDLGEHGHRVGVMLAAETGTESGEELARLLADLPERVIGVDLNPGNLVIGGFSPLEAVAALGPSILSVHATDAVLDSPSGRGEPVALGQGGVDVPALLGSLQQHDYRGYFTVVPAGTDDPAEELARQISYLRTL